MKIYRYISFDEIKVGFKCQTCYSPLVRSDKDKWVDIEFTQEFYDEYIELILADAYDTEFRVPLEKR